MSIEHEHDFVIYVSRDSDWRPKEEDSRFRFVRCHVSARDVVKRTLYEMLLLPRHARRHGISLFHGTGNLLPPALGVTSVVTVHFINSFTTPELVPGRPVRLFNSQMRRSLRAATRVIAVSSALSRELQEILRVAHAKIDVIPYGVSEIFRRAERRSRISTEELQILLVTNALPHKNNELAIKAAGILAARSRRHVRLLAAGDPKIGSQLGDPPEGVVVDLLGMRTPGELARLFASSDVFLMPSLAESFGLPVLEAMATGIPVACSDIDAHREVGGEVPFYFDPHDAVAAADALIHAFREDSTGERLKRGRQKSDQYRWEETARRTIRTYERAVAATN